MINGAGSVFGTPAGREWLRLLEAIERPASPARARAATLTCFFGWTAEQLAAADDEAWELVHRRLHHWARVLRVTGVAAMTETITAVEGLPARVLQAADGERRLTDLRHIGQLLHAAATAEQLGPTALAGWLRERVAEAERDTGDEERSRRLESDAEAVQVLTVHRSKGLEFPVVYLPFLWEPGFVPKGNPPIVFHDPSDDDRRAIDVSLAGSEYQAHKQQSVEERRGEDLRLAYVALTRAKHQAVVWWAGSFDSRNSPLGRLLFAREPDGTIAPAGAATPTDAAATERFRELAAEAPGCISVERSALGMPASWAGPLAATADLTAARFDRDLDWGWRRTSYSDITAGTYEARVSQRAGGDRRRATSRRSRGRRSLPDDAGAGAPRARSLAPGRPARRRPRRHARAPGPRGDRLRRARPRRGPAGAGRGGPGAAPRRGRRSRRAGRRAAGVHRDAARAAGRRRSRLRDVAATRPPRRAGVRAAARRRRRRRPAG